MIAAHSTYRDYLKAVIAERSARREKYSVRAFARSLGLTPSFLADVLKGRKNLSAEGALRVASALKLEDADREYFRMLVQLETSQDPEVRGLLRNQVRDMQSGAQVTALDVDRFRAIADWYHFSILYLTWLPGFRFTPHNVARKLGIAASEAERAIDRLLRLGLLKQTKTGYKTAENSYRVEAPTPEAAILEFHRQVLDKAREALPRQRAPERFGATEVYALDPKCLGEARKILNKAFDDIAKLARNHPERRGIYALSTHLFRVTDPGC